tara:strand:- start:274 stop:945 length:672 start_codon:yes stop_codon:yes gene_type:complete
MMGKTYNGRSEREHIIGGDTMHRKSGLKFDNIHLTKRTYIWKVENSIIKVIKQKSNKELFFDNDSYNEFSKNNLNFVKVKKFKRNKISEPNLKEEYYLTEDTVYMEYVPGITLWEYSCLNSRDKTWNICINYYWKFIKAMIDFSENKMNNSKVFFHCDLNSHNIIINNDIPRVIDPDSFYWVSKDFFIKRIRENIFNFFDEDRPEFTDLSYKTELSLNLFGKL